MGTIVGALVYPDLLWLWPCHAVHMQNDPFQHNTQEQDIKNVRGLEKVTM